DGTAEQLYLVVQRFFILWANLLLKLSFSAALINFLKPCRGFTSAHTVLEACLFLQEYFLSFCRRQ
ncbi:MAG TPA: hypothetical protein DHV03_07275, partial [Alphaproteobacteria bacterium]|nr:hypothetical protein [Alphaproteobacteria bacterium]